MRPGVIKTRCYAAWIGVLAMLSTSVHATDGNFVGNVPMDMACSAPSVPNIPFTASMAISITGTSVVLSIADAASDFIYGGTGTLSGGIATVSGTVLINTGNTSIDGTYSPASFSLSITDNVTSLTVSGSGGSSGGSPCSLLSYGLTSSGTLISINDLLLINPEETPSNNVTEGETLSTDTKNKADTIGIRTNYALRSKRDGGKSQRTSSGLLYNMDSGLNAGDAFIAYGLWASYSYTDFDNDFTATAFDGTTHGFMGGMDISPWEDSVIGIAFGFDLTDIDTDFNAGKSDSNGYTIAAYYGRLITDTFSVDAMVGYTRVDTEQFRRAGGVRFDSNPDTDRYFGALNINGVWYRDNWVFGARTGWLYARADTDAFIETGSNNTTVAQAASTSRLNQWSVGGDAGYSFGEFEPFGRFSYEYDYNQTALNVLGAKNDKDSLVAGFGFRYYSESGFTGNFEWARRFGKANYDESTLNFTLRGEF